MRTSSPVILFNMALRCLLGGAGISVAAHELLLLTGDTFGISGFAHRGVKGNAEALMGVAGLIIGGVLVAYMERGGTPRSPALNISLGKILFSGFLVGIGTKVFTLLMLLPMSNGTNIKKR